MLRNVFAYIIRIYQLTLSPDHGPLRVRYPYGFCRFYPSCSEYTRLSILRFGVARGVWLGAKRIVRCNPYSEPRIDRVSNT